MCFILRAEERAPVFAFLLVLCSVALSAQTPPTWWTERQVLTPGATADDYAVANVGQLKYLASKAALEMDAKLSPGGAGTAIDDLILAWLNPPAGAPPADDYAVMNQGQLKYVAKLFYDRLADFDYSGAPLAGGARYPWTHGPGQESDDDNHAAVNLGQLKYVFSFSIASIISDAYNIDTDGDGIPNGWEIENGLDPLDPADAANTNGGPTYLELYQQSLGAGGDPTVANTAGLILYTP